MNKIKLIIFDLDGVLVEAKKIHYDTLNEALSNVDSSYVISWNEHLNYMNNRDHNSDDWFGICDYYTYKKIWNNPDDIYSEVVKSSFNAESIVLNFCQINNIKIQHLKFNQIYVNKPAGKVHG